MSDDPLNGPLELLFRGLPSEYLAMLEPSLLAFVESIRRGTITHEELADAMVRHVPQAAAVPRAEVLAKLHAKCPTRQDLVEFLTAGVGRFILSGIIVAVAVQKTARGDQPGASSTVH